ncbi:hypothetical protein [Mycolicibacterium gilvum]|uniref:hypothetical protein n=1 Tax=Mycolicibacterium gilvum TaxID=1804 RepID=UPI0040463D3D
MQPINATTGSVCIPDPTAIIDPPTMPIISDCRRVGQRRNHNVPYPIPAIAAAAATV